MTIESSEFDRMSKHYRIASEILNSRDAARRKHGEHSMEVIPSNDHRWLSILMEEVGEAAKELNYDSTGSLRAELIDVITVATVWIAAPDRDTGQETEEEEATA